MGLRFAGARLVSRVSTWGLKYIFRRPAANFPGKVALYVDPSVIAHLAPRLTQGSLVVVGTNGKTSTTNLLADALEAQGRSVVCNRTGANLDSGVATSLLQSKGADWGVFECDELWLAKVLPYLQATYVLLLNLFRDQLDRCGEIDRIQDSIVGALESSPHTTLLYNADDPLCAAIAQRVSNETIAYGIAEDLHLAQNTVVDAQMCQRCSGMLDYAFRQYGQLGSYHCTHCDFTRPSLDFAAVDVHIEAEALSFTVVQERSNKEHAEQQVRFDETDEPTSFGQTDSVPESQDSEVEPVVVHSTQSSPYVAYNLLAAFAAADMMGCPTHTLQQAIDAFDPQNGRLQTYEIAGRHVLLNLAKNPTGFNQNLKIINQDQEPKVVAFFINDKEGDGRDISWLWDVDYEELATQSPLVAFAGGIRKNDLQVRLKYAGIQADLVDNVEEVFDRLATARQSFEDANVYVVANYTALPPVHEDLNRLARTPLHNVGAPVEKKSDRKYANTTADTAVVKTTSSDMQSPLVVAHLFPDLLNLYGDGGNVRIIEQRCCWRGIPCDIKRVTYGENIDLSHVDLVFLGGAPDREQRLASEELMRMKENLRTFVESDGALLAICGGYQILGSAWLLGDEVMEGLHLVDIETHRAGSSANRLIDNIVLRSLLVESPLVGYENHAGRTHLGKGATALGEVISSTGHGNNDSDRCDGVRYRKVIGTYLHGPVLSKNPQLADVIISNALARWAQRTGNKPPLLVSLDDREEQEANAFMCKRLGVSV